MTGTETSLASVIAHKITDFSEKNNVFDVFEEISFYGDSAKDGSATMSFEWIGDETAHEMGNKVLALMQDIKTIIVGLMQEAKEQEPPRLEIYPEKNSHGVMLRALYRFRIWPVNGDYEPYEAQLAHR